MVPLLNLDGIALGLCTQTFLLLIELSLEDCMIGS